MRAQVSRFHSSLALESPVIYVHLMISTTESAPDLQPTASTQPTQPNRSSLAEHPFSTTCTTARGCFCVVLFPFLTKHPLCICARSLPTPTGQTSMMARSGSAIFRPYAPKPPRAATAPTHTPAARARCTQPWVNHSSWNCAGAGRRCDVYRSFFIPATLALIPNASAPCRRASW